MSLMKAMMRAAGVTVGSSQTLDFQRDSTLDDGMRQVLGTIELLAELDTRLAVIQRDLVGPRGMPDGELPDPRDIGLHGYVPKLMEASLYIGALSRRMHLRAGVIEAAIGRRRRPAFEDMSAVDRTRYTVARKKDAAARPGALPPPAKPRAPSPSTSPSAKRPQPRPRPNPPV